MIRNKLLILSCACIQDELAKILGEVAFDGLTLVPVWVDCGHPLDDTNVFQDGALSCIALGGTCLDRVRNQLPPEVFAAESGGGFREVFADLATLQPHLDQGAGLLTPGMLRQWRENRGVPVLLDDRRSALDETVSKLVLLDSGTDSSTGATLEAMGKKLGLPVETLDIGLHRLRSQIHRMIDRWRQDDIKRCERKLTDFAMVHDLLSGITALTHERDVIKQVMELFNMLCAPAQVYYLSMHDGAPGDLYGASSSASAAGEEVKTRLFGLGQAYRKEQESAGFLINITRGTKRLGALELRRVAFPEYLSHYLNLSLNILPVIALAVTNARTYQRRLDAERQVRALNGELEKRLAAVNALNKELETFTYSVSHDLRAPLRSLDGFSHILQRDYPENLDSRGRHFLERIRVNARRMGQLIDDLLHLSRLTRGKLNLTRVDLGRLARERLADLQQSEPQRKVEIHVDDEMAIVGDLRLLRSLVENLIGNAWKYTGKTEEARIRFSREQAQGQDVFTIEDNGTGFDMNYADKLFAPFQRLHGSEEFQGSGIGLATAQRIVQRHGGRIWADAVPGHGAAFHFTHGDYELPV